LQPAGREADLPIFGQDHVPTERRRREQQPMIRAILAALVLGMMMFALATGPGVSQKMKDMKKEQSAPKKKEDDKDYKAAVDRLPDQKFDPWRNMR
jgi:hypothetical protein